MIGDSIFKWLSTRAGAFLQRILLPNLRELFRDFIVAGRTVAFKYRITDTWAVLRSSGTYLAFAILAVVVFYFLPQGRDVMYILLDSWSDDGKQRFIWYLIFLLISLWLWSVASEFGSRYAIYVSDNSGYSICTERVVFRKAVQKLVAVVFLMLPFLIISGSLVAICVPEIIRGNKDQLLPLGITLLVIYLSFSQLIARYFAANRKNNFWHLPDEERKYVEKLFGIYKDYTYSLPADLNFSNLVRGSYERFSDSVEDKERFAPNFPQSSAVADAARVPVDSKGSDGKRRPGFRLTSFQDGSSSCKYSSDQYKWTYEVPLKYFVTLHRQVRIIALVSLIIYLGICLLSVFKLIRFGTIGAPALLCGAFACWSGIYVGVLYLDYGKLRRKWFSARLFLVMLFLISCFTHDHPVRKETERRAQLKPRPTLQAHFAKWLQNYQDSILSNAYYVKAVKDSGRTDSVFYPVIFVCAEGGALRTGAYTAIVLSTIQDSLAKRNRNEKIDFRKAIYAYSGVSGGSVGIGFFNAITTMNTPDEFNGHSYTALSRSFFRKDYLAPLLGRLLYADILNFFSPVYIASFDRAAALETSWETGYQSLLSVKDHNTFARSFSETIAGDTCGQSVPGPALFINTTEVEDGLQCWITNVNAAGSNIPKGDRRDLLYRKVNFDINYSTGINFSTRFPIFSPAGSVSVDGSGAFHYVDGGYVENTGASTMLEILQALDTPLRRRTRFKVRWGRPGPVTDSPQVRIKPYVIMLRFGETAESVTSSSSFRTLTSDVINGIYNTRLGRSLVAMDQLQRYVERELKGTFIDLPLPSTTREVPMNWILSQKSLNLLDSTVKHFWFPKTLAERQTNIKLRSLFGLDTNCFRCPENPPANYYNSF